MLFIENKITKTLGNITRVKILACLGRSDKTVTELLSVCSLSQSAVSQHLSYLRKAGLVVCERKGKYQVYKVIDNRLSILCKDILQLVEDLKKY
ncbi:winged helix-turn-helix transcriptional regulator [bacterium]|nr:winged helix-turn-helix transcriptional regulator [bacterium]